jgi:3-phenylpropionate/cinnamic acid dioxygenase small subunit
MAATPKLTRQEAEDFLFEEARLIDERQFTQWMELFAEGGFYWIPIVEDSDPTRETSILYDDDALRELRVAHLLHERNFAQIPPSRTVHQVTNVQVWHEVGQEEALVRCNLVVHEIRTGDHLQLGLGDQRALASKCEYRLRYQEDCWRIALKKVVLINRHVPITNLSFLL